MCVRAAYYPPITSKATDCVQQVPRRHLAGRFGAQRVALHAVRDYSINSVVIYFCRAAVEAFHQDQKQLVFSVVFKHSNLRKCTNPAGKSCDICGPPGECSYVSNKVRQREHNEALMKEKQKHQSNNQK
jgi:hypothetical protein